MDLKMLMSGIDLDSISSHLNEVIELVKNENSKINLLEGEDGVYILLDIKKDDIICYRITTGIIEIENKKFLEIKRTLGKWNLADLKNLIGDASLSIENTIRKILPIINSVIAMTSLKPNEKRISIQLALTNDDIIAYQIVLAVYGEKEMGLKLVVNRILGKYNLKEYLK